jgi:transketolase
MDAVPASVRRQGTLKGAYIVQRESSALERILIATGSEVQHVLKAAQVLGSGTRVVSMPSMELFARQTPSYRDEILPPACTARLSLEAGSTLPWGRIVGHQGKALGIDRFGLSAPGDIAMRELGITADAVVAAARQL